MRAPDLRATTVGAQPVPVRRKTLYIEKTKFKKDRLIPVPLAAAKELENYLAARDTLLKNEPVVYLLVGCWRNRLPQNTINATFNKAVKAIRLHQPRRVIGHTISRRGIVKDDDLRFITRFLRCKEKNLSLFHLTKNSRDNYVKFKLTS